MRAFLTLFQRGAPRYRAYTYWRSPGALDLLV